ncbi:MAG TPA: hypothetical protein VGE66_03940 [Chitinophagaceae bacterium]
MNTDKKNNNAGEEGRMPPASYGNASNPSPHKEEAQPAGNQLLDERAEQYLRESANIEDVPDAEDQEEADETLYGGA